MNEVFIKKEDMGSWIEKLFDKDLISINDMISVIEDLASENEHLQEEIEHLENLKDESITDPYEYYGVSEHEFH